MLDDNPSDLSTDTLRSAWGSIPPADQLAAFAALPNDKRQIALDRVKLLTTLVSLSADGDPPSRREQAQCAASLGIGLKRLQQMMRRWRAKPDLADIVPRIKAKRRAPRASASLDIARQIVADAIGSDPMAAEPTVRKRIAAFLHDTDHPVPARATIMRMLADARRATKAALEPSQLGSGSTVKSIGFDLLLIDLPFAAVHANSEGAQVEATALIELETGYIIALANKHDLNALVTSAKLSLIDEPFEIGPWTGPTRLYLAAAFPPATHYLMAANAAKAGVKIHPAKPLTRARRFATAAISLDAPLSPAPRRSITNAKPSSWPRLDERDLDCLLARTVTTSNIEIERRLDQGTGRTPNAGAANIYRILKSLFTEGSGSVAPFADADRRRKSCDSTT